MSVITDINNKTLKKKWPASQPSNPPGLSDSVGPSQIPKPSSLALGWRRFSGYFRPSGPLDPSVGDDLNVPPGLASIAPIFRVANEIEEDNPRVAYLCRFLGILKAHEMDPPSSGRGVGQFKTLLLHKLETDEVETRHQLARSDPQEILKYYHQFYEKNIKDGEYTKELEEMAKNCQIATVLYDLLMTVVPRSQIDKQALKMAEDVRKKREQYVNLTFFRYMLLVLNQQLWNFPRLYMRRSSYFHLVSEHLKYTGFRGRILEIILAFRFLIYQYGIVYHLDIAHRSKSLLVYGLSWVVLVTVLLVLMIVSTGGRRFGTNLHLRFRILEALLFLGFMPVMTVLFVVCGLTVSDLFAAIPAFLPTGWALLLIGQACRPVFSRLGFWESIKELGRAYDCIMGLVIFMSIAILSWFLFVSEFQRRILFNQAFSRGLQISRILAGRRDKTASWTET